MIRYIENIDISFSISIYRIVSYRRKKYRIFRYIAISFIYHDIFDISRYFTSEVYIFIISLLHYQNNKNKRGVVVTRLIRSTKLLYAGPG